METTRESVEEKFEKDKEHVYDVRAMSKLLFLIEKLSTFHTPFFPQPTTAGNNTIIRFRAQLINRQI